MTNFQLSTVLILIFFIWIYSTVNDMLKDVSMESSLNFMFGNLTGTNFTHPLMCLTRNSTTKFVAGVSTVSTAVMANLPVRLIYAKNSYNCTNSIFKIKRSTGKDLIP